MKIISLISLIGLFFLVSGFMGSPGNKENPLYVPAAQLRPSPGCGWARGSIGEPAEHTYISCETNTKKYSVRFCVDFQGNRSLSENPPQLTLVIMKNEAFTDVTPDEWLGWCNSSCDLRPDAWIGSYSKCSSALHLKARVKTEDGKLLGVKFQY